MKNVVDRITSVCIVIVLALSFFWAIVHPDDINLYENRTAVKLTFPHFSDFFSGAYQSTFNEALADQIPMAQTGKSIYNEFTVGQMYRVAKPLMEKNPNRYVYLKNDIFLFQNHLVSPPDADYERVMTSRVKNINSFACSYQELDFYAFYVCTEHDYDFEQNKPCRFPDELKERINTDRVAFASLNNDGFEVFDKYFYQTDHHWNAFGSYLGYCLLTDLLNIPPSERLIPVETVDTGRIMVGSKGKMMGVFDLFGEDFIVSRFDFPEMDIAVNGTPGEYGGGDRFLNDPGAEMSYAGYYGDDCGETVFDTHREGEKDRILIIGDSYDNAVIKLLACHFDKTFSVDLRNFERENGHPFHFSEYVKENGITKVLFIGGYAYYTLDDFNMED